jgi:hypothetical protein
MRLHRKRDLSRLRGALMNMRLRPFTAAILLRVFAPSQVDSQAKIHFSNASRR